VSVRPRDLGCAEAAALLAARRLSPVELLQDVLDRIAEVESRVRAYAAVLEDEALAAAREAEREIAGGGYRGPLHGIPLALKDLFDTAGIPTTWGSAAHAGRVPTTDSTAAARLSAAGAILIGKTVTHELACGVTSPPTSNPWDLDRVPGGSSGGSAAALAAAECLLALGTDTNGSIRIPAALTGVVGLKPTFGLVSRSGVMPASWSLDYAGPMARTVTGVAHGLGAIAGHDANDPSTATARVTDYLAEIDAGVAGLRVGIPRNFFFEEVQSAVQAAVEGAAHELERLGATLVPVTIPHATRSLRTGLVLALSEIANLHAETLRTRGDLLGDDARRFLEVGTVMPAQVYIKALQVRVVIKEAFRDAFQSERLDALLTPTLPATAARKDQLSFTYPRGTVEDVEQAYVRLCNPFNCSGQPALSLPCGFDEAQLPIGLQIVGRPFDEATVLRIGWAYERETAWHQMAPPL
jgi:aspartyl-tRNA(Asn)/glutamyl-tRNA(Gln) amidotransferase subunit A